MHYSEHGVPRAGEATGETLLYLIAELYGTDSWKQTTVAKEQLYVPGISKPNPLWPGHVLAPTGNRIIKLAGRLDHDDLIGAIGQPHAVEVVEEVMNGYGEVAISRHVWVYYATDSTLRFVVNRTIHEKDKLTIEGYGLLVVPK